MKEIWKPVLGHDYHEISNLGRIRSYQIVSGKIKYRLLNPWLNKKGYYQISFWVAGGKGKQKHSYIARLVAQAFIPNPTNRPQVNHINGIPTDNIVTNLEWCTPKENSTHASTTGLLDESRYKKARGEAQGHSKLTEEQVLYIKKALATGKRGIVTQLAKEMGVAHPAISDIKRGITWKHM